MDVQRSSNDIVDHGEERRLAFYKQLRTNANRQNFEFLMRSRHAMMSGTLWVSLLHQILCNNGADVIWLGA